MTTQAIKQNKVTSAFNAKQFISFALNKIAENVGEMLLTLITTSITISAVVIVAPAAAQEMSGFIIGLFLLLQLRRIVQDFDESWTHDEIAEQLSFMDSKLDNIERMVRDETILTADDDPS